MFSLVLLLVAILLSVQVDVVRLPGRRYRASWLVRWLLRRRAAVERERAALGKLNMKRWRHKVTFGDDGRLSIRPRWFIKRKRRIVRIAVLITSLVITYHFLTVPICLPLAVINSNGTGGGNWSAGASWNGGTAPGTGDDAVILANDTIVVDQATETTGSCEIQLDGILNLNGNQLDFDGENGAGYIFDNDGTLQHGNGVFNFVYAGDTLADFAGNGNPYDVIVNIGGNTLTLDTAATFEGDLTITAGTLDTSGSNYALTVTIDVDITGEITGNASAISFGSLTVQAAGTYTATSGVTTITSETAGGLAVDIDGTFTHSSGTVTITYAGATTVDLLGTGNLYNLTLNNGGNTVTLTTATTIANNLTITAGTLDTSGSNFALTITADVDISGTLTGNASAISMGSCTINAGGTYTATSGTTTITSETAGGYALVNDAAGVITHSNGTFTFTYAGTTLVDTGGDSLYNVIANHASLVLTLDAALTAANDLTITAGELTCSGSNHALTVTADADVTGTLTGTAASISLGSLTVNAGGTYSATSGTTTITSEASSGYCFDNDGTYIHNNGTLTVTYAGTANFDMMGAVAGNLYNVIINDASADIRWVGDSTIDNDLTITAGLFRPSGIGDTLTVTGDVDITGTLGLATATDTNTFGSLTINSGGTYIATSGTTTITSETAGGFAFDNDGTLTNNSGTFAFSYAGATQIDTSGTAGNFYNLILNNANLAVTMTTAMTVDNDLTITLGSLSTGSNLALTVTADADVTGTLTGNASAISLGSLTINSGGTYSATSGTTTITAESAVGNAIWVASGGTYTHNNGLATVTATTTTRLKFEGTGNLYNLTYTPGATPRTLECRTNITIDNDLTVSSDAVFNTQAASVDYDLTVTGITTVSGTVTGNASAISMGSLTINAGGTYSATSGTTTITSETAGGYAFDNDGTLTHNNGNFTFTYAGTTLIDAAGTAGNFYDLTINNASMVFTLDTAMTVDNNLDITTGEIDTSGSNYALTITGTTQIDGTLTLNSSAVDLNGAVLINVGGTITAPDGSGSLNINGNFDNSGTFTHSSGTVTFDPSATRSINNTGSVAFTFNNITLAGTAADKILLVLKDTAIEGTLTITTGKFTVDATSTAVTLTMGTNAAKGSIVNNDTLTFLNNTTNRTTVAAASSAYPCEVSGGVDWDGGGNLSIVTAQDLILQDAQTVGTSTVTLTATRCRFNAVLTVTTATFEGTYCVIDASTMSVSSGLYVEGWYDPTETARGGYDWILVGGDYTLTSNKSYTSKHFYKQGSATLTLDTGVTLTVTDCTEDGTYPTDGSLLDTNNGTYTMQYSVDMKLVKPAGTAIASATVVCKDKDDNTLWTQTTDSNGDITAQNTVYAVYGTGADTNYPHTFTVSKSGYKTTTWAATIDKPYWFTLTIEGDVSTTGGDTMLNETVTLYQAQSLNDYGEITYDAGTNVAARVEQTETEVRDSMGELRTSTTRIFVPASTTVDANDKLDLPDGSTVYIISVKMIKDWDGTTAQVVIYT